MLSPKAAIVSVFKNYATFAGRASRSEYWWFQIFQTVLYTLVVAAGFLPAFLNPPPVDEPKVTAIVSVVVLLLLGLVFVVPNIAVFVRRLHDIDFSGWFYFLGMIPGVGVFIIVVFALLPSNPAGARFDPVKNLGNDTPSWRASKVLS